MQYLITYQHFIMSGPELKDTVNRPVVALNKQFIGFFEKNCFYDRYSPDNYFDLL